MSEVALIYQPVVDGALSLAEQCANLVEARGSKALLIPSLDTNGARSTDDIRLAVTFGGDGTILRAARWLVGSQAPIVGIRMGRLGFLAELAPGDLPGALAPYLDGDYWLDRRAMLQAEIAAWGAWVDEPGARMVTPVAAAEAAPLSDGASPAAQGDRIASWAPGAPASFIALNDVVVGRGQSVRTVTVDVSFEGHSLHQFRCDGLIVATATGSTAYSFAAGGPVLEPSASELAVTAICPHISSLRSLVLPGDRPLRLQVWSPQMAMVTIDGQIDHLVGDGAVVTTSLSPCTTVFARRGTPAEFYSRLLAKLD